jgi:hypothetical protein
MAVLLSEKHGKIKRNGLSGITGSIRSNELDVVNNTNENVETIYVAS